jgi:preprotein translocase subunit YajC
MGAEAQGAGFIWSFLPLIVLFAIFYFLVIRPQQQQAKRHKEMIENLKKGDKVTTTGGIMGEIVKVEEDFLKVEIADNTVVRLAKEYIASKTDDEEK